MIGSLRGTVLAQQGSSVLLEVGGIGYWVTVLPGVASALSGAEDQAFIHIYHHIREDAQVLYGFATNHERRLFEVLLSAHGVGPSLAMAILSTHAPARLLQAIASDDLAALCLVPGVGKKTAQRLLIELKPKLDLPEFEFSATDDEAQTAKPSVTTDAHDALVELGYQSDEIRAVLKQLPNHDDASALLRAALRELGAQR